MIKLKGEFLYTILKPFTRKVFYNKFKVIEGDYVLPEKPESFIIIGHHVSAFDPIILNVFSKRYIRFLYGDANSKLKIRNMFLRGLDMIAFSKNSADFKSIRILKERLKMGQVIGLYPEGGASWDGSTDKIIASTSKLIKMMKVPVYGVEYNGAYLSKPRWCKNTRRGKVIMNTYTLFDQDEIQSLSHSQIHDRLVQALTYNEFEWQAKNLIRFKGKDLAEYIERLLYKCPECLSYNIFVSKGDEFSCKHCNSRFRYNEFGFIEHLEGEGFKPYNYDLVKWNKWQQHDLCLKLSDKTYKDFKNLIGFNNEFLLHGVTLTIDDVKQTNIYYGIDHIRADSQTIYFADMSSQSITFGFVVEFFYDKYKYHMEFLPESNLSIKLFYDSLEYFKEVRHES